MDITTRIGITTVLSCALLLGGCIVHATSTTGVLEVRWDNSPAACYGINGVRVRVERAGTLFDESPQLDCEKGFYSFALEPGTYDVTIIGLNKNGASVQGGGVEGLQVDGDSHTLSPRLEMKTTGGSGAGLRTKWTAAGQSAGQGCAKLDVSKVTVSVFDSKLANIVGQATVSCAAGQVTLSGLATGEVWVQIDASDADGQAFYGNANVVGPIELTGNTITALALAEDVIDLRASIDVPWQFANGKTCGGNGVGTIQIEIRRPGGDIIVPLSAADATKACDLGPSNTMAQRAIDLQFISPTCSIPAGADGLVICGILDRNLDVRAVAVSEQGNAIAFGGWLKIRDLKPGVFTDNNKPLYLEKCSASGVDCTVN